MAAAIELPLGPYPDWELEDSDAEDSLNDVADSFTVLQTLRQSRQRWLQSNLPKFSVKARSGKQPDVVPPPHISRTLGRCDVEIGPHSFINTTIVEVKYTPAQPTPSTASSSVSSELIAQVNRAAANSPQLTALLHTAATGQATPEQLRTLGLLIQALPTAPVQSTVTPSQPSSSCPPTGFDLVLEFREKTSTRWLFPRKPAVCERVAATQFNAAPTILVTTVVEPASALPDSNSGSGQAPVVTFRFMNPPAGLWELLQQWAGGEQTMHKNESILQSIIESLPERQYVQHRLPDGPLLNTLRDRFVHRYSMRPIDPTAPENLAASARKNSATRKRKQADSKSRVQGPSLESPNQRVADQASSSTAMITSKMEQGAVATAVRPDTSPWPTESQETALNNPASGSALGDPLPTKRRRSNTILQAAAIKRQPIACHGCRATGVPLLLGGRFCRRCIEENRVPNLSNPSLISEPSASTSQTQR